MEQDDNGNLNKKLISTTVNTRILSMPYKANSVISQIIVYNITVCVSNNAESIFRNYITPDWDFNI